MGLPGVDDASFLLGDSEKLPVGRITWPFPEDQPPPRTDPEASRLDPDCLVLVSTPADCQVSHRTRSNRSRGCWKWTRANW